MNQNKYPGFFSDECICQKIDIDTVIKEDVNYDYSGYYLCRCGREYIDEKEINNETFCIREFDN